MQIEIRIDGEKKAFSIPYIPGRYLRKGLEMRNEVNLNNLSPTDIDKLVEFTVHLFNEQFTIDDVLDGLSNDELVEECVRVLQTAIVGEKEFERLRKKSEEDNPKN